jgi:hypothetical protein
VGFKGEAYAEKLCGGYVKDISGHRVEGRVTYPLDEILLATLAGALRGADDFDAIALLSRECVTWLKQFLPDNHGVANAQSFRKVFRLLTLAVLNECFGACVASMQDVVRGLVAIVLRQASATVLEVKGDHLMEMLSGPAGRVKASAFAPAIAACGLDPPGRRRPQAAIRSKLRHEPAPVRPHATPRPFAAQHGIERREGSF